MSGINWKRWTAASGITKRFATMGRYNVTVSGADRSWSWSVTDENGRFQTGQCATEEEATSCAVFTVNDADMAAMLDFDGPLMFKGRQ